MYSAPKQLQDGGVVAGMQRADQDCLRSLTVLLKSPVATDCLCDLGKYILRASPLQAAPSTVLILTDPSTTGS